MSTRKRTSRADGPGESTATRVESPDGTEIGYWTSGTGPPLVLVHGNPADHTRWRPLLPYLEPYATVHAMDRRGRGASGDAPSYHVEREYEDVAAVVDAVAAVSGSQVDVYGHSMGGFIAFGAALRTSNIRRLVLYEGWPPTNPQMFAYPPGLGDRLDTLLAAGDLEGVLETYFRHLLTMSDEQFSALRSQPSWQGRLAAAHTITREDRAYFATPFDPRQAAKIAVPTLLVTGGDSPDSFKGDVMAVAAALPDARIVVLHGQQHVGDVLAPPAFAQHVVAFLRGRT
jgi:pimeloyl-ACP methyl ester carboxylesterase